MVLVVMMVPVVWMVLLVLLVLLSLLLLLVLLLGTSNHVFRLNSCCPDFSPLTHLSSPESPDSPEFLKMEKKAWNHQKRARESPEFT